MRDRVGHFTAEEIARCKAAMGKPAPMQALRIIASGRAIVVLSKDGRDVDIDEFDGERIRDPDHPDRRMGLAGAWPLYRAGMIDEFCVVTPAGRTALSQPAMGGDETPPPVRGREDADGTGGQP